MIYTRGSYTEREETGARASGRVRNSTTRTGWLDRCAASHENNEKAVRVAFLKSGRRIVDVGRAKSTRPQRADGKTRTEWKGERWVERTQRAASTKVDAGWRTEPPMEPSSRRSKIYLVLAAEEAASSIGLPPHPNHRPRLALAGSGTASSAPARPSTSSRPISSKPP